MITKNRPRNSEIHVFGIREFYIPKAEGTVLYSLLTAKTHLNLQWLITKPRQIEK